MAHIRDRFNEEVKRQLKERQKTTKTCIADLDDRSSCCGVPMMYLEDEGYMGCECGAIELKELRQQIIRELENC